MADAFSLPMAEIAALLSEGKLKARTLVEEAIANHERFGAKLMAYSQWAPEHARKCADAADAAFAVGSRAGSLQGIPTSINKGSHESECRSGVCIILTTFSLCRHHYVGNHIPTRKLGSEGR